MSSVMPDGEPIAKVEQVFSDGSYRVGWLYEHVVDRIHNTRRILSKEAQKTSMWIKAHA